MKQTTRKLLGISCVILSLMVLTASLSLVEGASVPTINVGGTPFGVAVTPDGKYVYVSNFENVSVIDTATNRVVTSIVTEKLPMGIAVTPDGKSVYVTHSTSEPPIASVISTATNTVVDTIELEHSANEGIAITHDGKYVYMTTWEGVMVISTETNKVTEYIYIAPLNPDWTDPTNGITIPSSGNPHSVALSPDDKYAYVGTADFRVVVIDISTNKIVKTIEVESGIWDIAVAPDGKHLYATSGDDKIFIIDTAANAVTATLTGFGSPLGIAVTDDGKYAYVGNNWNSTVFVLNTATNVVDKTITVGQGPREVVFSPDGKHAYVTCDTDNSGTAGTIWVLSISEDSTLSQATPQATVPTAEFPTQLLVVIILVAVIALFAGIIAVKMKPWKKPSADAHRML
ncbi:MAG: YncE family protein [Candidatus Bathyarchaeota archaeon]|nr:YncE family protein [Candidatus Bathyarchaeota archaeon]